MTRYISLLIRLILVPSYLTFEYVNFDMQKFFHTFRHPKLIEIPISKTKGGRLLTAATTCDIENPSYEYIGGVTINSHGDVISQTPFTNSVEDCISACNADSRCESLELTEGVCLLYSMSYDSQPDKFEKQPINGIHSVLQKRCQSSTCNASWQTELNSGYRLDGYTALVKDGCTKDECISACQTVVDFKCRSVNYNPETKTCELNTASRSTLASTASLVNSEDTLYIENNCVEEPLMVCTYEPLVNVIPTTFDAFYLNIRSDDECKRKCEESSIRCRSYTYGTVANVPMCFLTHSASSEALPQESPLCYLSNVQTTELKSCYNFYTLCDENGFQVVFEASREFNGLVFPPHSPYCQVSVENNTTFTFVAQYNEETCNVNDNGNGHYETEIQLQHYKPYITEPDFIIKTECEYIPPTTTTPAMTTTEVYSTTTAVTDAGAQFTTESFTESTTPVPLTCPEPVTQPPQIIIEQQQQQCPEPVCPACEPQGPPQMGITVLHRNGSELTEDPKIGDPVALIFFMSDMNSPFAPRITDVAAVNVKDDSVFLLIDKRGCPTKPYIASKIYKRQQGLYMSDFEAFTFNQLDTIRYRANVEWCWMQCAPPICDDDGYELSHQNDVYMESLNNQI